MKNKGNTVYVIEHSLEVISASDYIVDLGPHGGVDGGEVIVSGTVSDLLSSQKGYTQRYLREFISD